MYGNGLKIGGMVHTLRVPSQTPRESPVLTTGLFGVEQHPGLRSAERGSDVPTTCSHIFGFRLALNPN